VDEKEIARYGATGTGVAHCPSSNMRLASGIAPIVKMLSAGVPVGLGVDGSASNDSSHMLAEARQAMLLQRVGGDSKALTARQALELGTLGGARVLGRDDIGSLEPGKAADCIGIDVNRLEQAGALHDPVAALVFCSPPRVDWSMIDGKIVVEHGELKTVDLAPVIEKHNRIAREMVARSHR
jgi:cytosine/adenosine deaminase-related metal-dependent hydrolase